MLLSIAIPVFNAEMYIADCVASLENRKSEGIEVLLVNDGSIDGSFAVYHCLTHGDNTIRVIDSENKEISIKDDFNTLFERNVFDSACLCLFNKSVVKSNGLFYLLKE